MLEELLDKMADGKKLNALERQQLREEARGLQEAKQLSRSWVVGGTSIPIFQPPMEVIYSKVLEADAASVTIQIPSTYKHLVIFSNGRTTGVGTANRALCAEFNGDTGSNYSEQDIYGVTTTPTASNLYTNIYFFVGMLAEGGQAAGKSGSGFCVIPHYLSSFYKSGMLMCTASNGSNYHSILATSFWNNTSPVTSVKLFASSGSIASGTVISIYGVL